MYSKKARGAVTSNILNTVASIQCNDVMIYIYMHIINYKFNKLRIYIINFNTQDARLCLKNTHLCWYVVSIHIYHTHKLGTKKTFISENAHFLDLFPQ